MLEARGSIERSTLDVIARHPDRYQASVLAANRSVDEMEALCLRHAPQYAVMGDAEAAAALGERLRDRAPTEVLSGPEGLDDLVADPAIHTVVAGIVGFAGLGSALSAARAGKHILLANKEALVSAGGLFMEAERSGGATLLPVDSEHNAMHQCLPMMNDGRPDMTNVEKIVLTASGGPFRGRARAALAHVTPEEACAHPNWSMGQKISVDSATLANKGLELAEACWLFDRHPDQIEIVVHPQSIVHSMIRYRDGSVLAQMGQPDMRTPIAYTLAWPRRMAVSVERLDLAAIGHLSFEAPDPERFPTLRIARDSLEAGGGAPTVLNAANEVAVEAFLAKKLGFLDIARVVESTLEAMPARSPGSIAEVLELDREARQRASAAASRAAIS